MTELVIRTIHKNTKRDNFRLVVLDNCSDHPTQLMLQGLHENGLIDELLVMDHNGGLEAARQYLFVNATIYDYFVDIDNDCLPPPMKNGQDWIERMISLMQKYEDFAAISMRTQVMIGSGNIFEEADDAGDDLVEFPHPGGSFRIMRSRAVAEVGGWDRENPGRGSEETYICGKLRDAGYRTAFAVRIRTLHLFGDRNQTKERWGYEDGMKPEETGHSDISHPVLTNGDDREEVLLYAGEGLTNAYMSNKG
jgi:glycosyltransferase involved in cell wall biosynthesis